MSSGFVSAGGEENKPRAGLSEYDADAWEKARQKIEELKKPKQDPIGTQEGGKSLYEHLQAQKAAKQEAFEEATKLRNQFRPLDDSEVEFLESIRQKEQHQASAERKETEEQLEAFRKERAAAEQKALDEDTSLQATKNDVTDTTETWTTTKKRRRADAEEKMGSSKAPKNVSSGEVRNSLPATEEKPVASGAVKNELKIAVGPAGTSKTSPVTSSTAERRLPVANLVAYDSDSDD